MNVSYGGICPPGYWCPKGTAGPLSDANACKNGTYNPKPGGQSESACLLCPSGKYCGHKGLSQPSGGCTPGYYCIGGATYGEPIDNVRGNICPEGSFCPGNSSSPRSCNPGTYRY